MASYIEDLMWRLSLDAKNFEGAGSSAEHSLLRIQAAMGDTAAQAKLAALGLDKTEDELRQVKDAASQAGGSGGMLGFLKSMTSTESALGTALAAFKNFGLATQGVQQAIGIVSGAFDKTFGELTRTTEALKQNAVQTGMTTTEWQRLAFAAEQSETKVEVVKSAFVKLGQGILDAQKGSAEAVANFKRLGIEIDSTTTTTEVFNKIADKFKAGVISEAEATELFGGKMSGILPLLSQGADGMKALGDRAERVGAVLDDAAIAAGDDLGDSITELNAAFSTLTNQLVAGAAPAITAVVQTLVGAISVFADARKAAIDLIADMVFDETGADRAARSAEAATARAKEAQSEWAQVHREAATAARIATKEIEKAYADRTLSVQESNRRAMDAINKLSIASATAAQLDAARLTLFASRMRRDGESIADSALSIEEKLRRIAIAKERLNSQFKEGFITEDQKKAGLAALKEIEDRLEEAGKKDTARRKEALALLKEVQDGEKKAIEETLQDETRSFAERKRLVQEMLANVTLSAEDRKDIAKKLADAEIKEEKRAAEERKRILAEQVDRFKDQYRDIAESEKLSNLERKGALTKFLRETAALERDQRDKLKSEREGAAKELAQAIKSLFESGEISFTEAQKRLRALSDEFPEFAKVVKTTENEVNAFRLGGLRRELELTEAAIDRGAVNERQRLRERLRALQEFGKAAALAGEKLLEHEKAIAAARQALADEETRRQNERFQEGQTAEERRIERELQEEKASRDRRQDQGHEAQADQQSIDRLETELFNARRSRLEQQIRQQGLSEEEAHDLRQQFFDDEAEAAETGADRKRIEREALKDQANEVKRGLKAQEKEIENNRNLSKQEKEAARAEARKRAQGELDRLKEEAQGKKAKKGAEEAAKAQEKAGEAAEAAGEAAKDAADEFGKAGEAAKDAAAEAEAQAEAVAKGFGEMEDAAEDAGDAIKDMVDPMAGQPADDAIENAADLAGALGGVGAVAGAAGVIVSEAMDAAAGAAEDGAAGIGGAIDSIAKKKDDLIKNFEKLFATISTGSGGAGSALESSLGTAIDAVAKKKDALIENFHKLEKAARQSIPTGGDFSAPQVPGAVTVNVGPNSITSPLGMDQLAQAVSGEIADNFGLQNKI